MKNDQRPCSVNPPGQGGTLELIDETLRDGTQSLWGMMMGYHMIEPVIGEIAEAGFDTIDTPVHFGAPMLSTRFFKEDPRYMFAMAKEKMKNTKSDVMLATLGCAVDITGAPQNATVVRLMFEQFKEWMPKFNRALVICCTEDEIQNQYPVLFPILRKLGIEPVPYMAIGHGPHHTEEFYASRVKHLVETFKPVSICIKDVDGLLTPERLRRLITAMQAAANDTPLELHAHGMNGLNTYNAVVAMDMGIRRITTCIPPLANGSSHPSVFDVVKNAEHMGISHNMDLDKLRVVEERLTKIGKAFGHPVDNPTLPFDLQAYEHQIPGGVISNTRTQLEQLGIPEALPEVLKEIPRILEDMGHPIMITPFSQFIVTQAVMNTQVGRWEECIDPCIEFAAGIYGYEEAGVAYMNQDIKDKLLSQPQAKAIIEKGAKIKEYIASEPSEAEVKAAVGLPADASREEFVLRYLLRTDDELKNCTPGGPDSYKKYL
jgi:oxaloacetate decarboxylase alpha subunit